MPPLSLPEDDAWLGRERTGGESSGGASAAPPAVGEEPTPAFPIPSPAWLWAGKGCGIFLPGCSPGTAWNTPEYLLERFGGFFRSDLKRFGEVFAVQ